MTDPKKPSKKDKIILRLTGPDGKYHFIWGDDYAGFCLQDALSKLAALEAEVAAAKGNVQ